ncbi:hypothetical protein [Vibrio quintilis]|uniref:Uncharacterized protein n=1 Tax=Vibrio quintilis TaxID=1117707 RepID=A0A1M7YNU8_9VIBR|nr:hypothetical protein [Vibrio quintilis]SHO54312.1 hypothetical protein VQ7734_00024 [Vibrio quintilis]
MDDLDILNCEDIVSLKRLILVRKYKNIMLSEAEELLKMAKCYEAPKELTSWSELLIININDLSEISIFPKSLNPLLSQVSSYIDYIKNHRNDLGDFEEDTLRHISYNISMLRNYLERLSGDYNEVLTEEELTERHKHLDWVENKA